MGFRGGAATGSGRTVERDSTTERPLRFAATAGRVDLVEAGRAEELFLGDRETVREAALAVGRLLVRADFFATPRILPQAGTP